MHLNCRTLLSTAVLFAATSSTASAETPGLHAIDLQGQVIQSVAPANARIVVMIFAATDCPISNRYIPEITRLDHEFRKQGVAFWWVFPNPSDTLETVRKHNQEYAITTPTLLDIRQELAPVAHASVTPEAAIFTVDNGLREIYHGRIDDRYLAFGKEHPQATHHDLENAIEAALNHKPIPKPSGNLVGCSIVPLTAK